MKSLIAVALSQIGVKEIKGPEHAPEVMKYFHECGFEAIKDDETAWCSAFVNWVAKIAGYSRSSALNARSWLKVGYAVEKPQLGDIVIFWRESVTSWKGHVGFYVAERGNNILTLGGNQNNEVCIKKYPVKRLLGYRRLEFCGWK